MFGGGSGRDSGRDSGREATSVPARAPRAERAAAPNKTKLQ